MAVETANVLHAMATLNLANPPSIIAGFGISSIVREGTGQYRVELLEPIDVGGGQAELSPAELVLPPNTARIAFAVIQSIASEGNDNLQLVSFNHDGVATDIGQAYFKVWRYPVVTAS